MKLLIIIFIFLSGCSAATNPTAEYLSKAQGTWKSSAIAQIFFADTIVPALNVPTGTEVLIGADGSFTIDGLKFEFVEVENRGVLAIYSFIHPVATEVKYLALGFNEQGNILFIPKTFLDITDPPADENGSLFLEK